MSAMPELLEKAKTIAAEYSLDPVLICAIIEQESSWRPWAVRFEPAFHTRYVVPLSLTPTEAHARSFSYGLMQVMGQVAREQGCKFEFLTELCKPEESIRQGCIKLKKCFDRANGDVTQALLCYNGGGSKNYPIQVLARMKNYA